MMRRVLAFGVCLFAELTLMLFILYAAGTCAPLMNALFARCSDRNAAALQPDDYPRLADALTGYLSGARADLSVQVTVRGQPREAFDDTEKAHMRDVRSLFGLCARLALWSAAIAALTGIAFRAAHGERGHMFRAMRWSSLLLLAVLAALTVWAVIDFNSVFYAFHLVAFSGMEAPWLLDPRTQLLIQLMPADFFVFYTALIGLGWLLALVVPLLAANRAIRRRAAHAAAAR